VKILLLPVGSYGDVHPFVGLGACLQQRGHDVTVMAAEPFASLIGRVGLQFRQLGTAEEYYELADDPNLWNLWRGFSTIARRAIIPCMRRQYDFISEQYAPGETLVIDSMLGVGTRLAHDKLGVPLVSIHLQPTVFWSEYEAPRLPRMLASRAVPRWVKRLQYAAADRFFVDPILLSPINELRHELGLDPIRHVNQMWHSPQRVIGLFPDWFAPPQPDWPPQTVLTGFPLWDEGDVTPMPAEVDAFLQAGDGPIVFTAGSAMRLGQKFFETAVAACEKLGRRGILLTRYAHQIPSDLPANVRHFEFVPFSQLLPHASAIVHHGGIGTTSQALQAAVPQLIMPMAFDQPDNAHRLKKLGVADSLVPHKFAAPAVAQKLAHLIGSSQVKEACVNIAQRFQGLDSLERTADVIEQVEI